MSTKRTPTPWDTDDPHIVYAKDDDRIVYLADTSDLDTDYATAKANAAHIVRCVNAHDELVAALTFIASHAGQTLLSMEHGQPYSIGAHDAFNQLSEVAAAALTRATT